MKGISLMDEPDFSPGSEMSKLDLEWKMAGEFAA
jgi:hypothetical protein